MLMERRENGVMMSKAGKALLLKNNVELKGASTSVTSPTSVFVVVSKNGHSVSFDLVGKINQWHWRECVSAIGAIILDPLCNCLDNNYADVNYPQSCTPLCNCSDNSGAPFWPEHR